MIPAGTYRPSWRVLIDVANAAQIGFLALAVVVAGAAGAAQPELERGNWKVTVASTVNGKAQPVEITESCLGDELKDLAAAFTPALEGAQAQCKRSRQPSNDPRKLGYRMQCSGPGFTVNAETAVTIENPRLFTVTIRTHSKAPNESALMIAKAEGRWTGPCEPAAKGQKAR